MFPVHFRVCQFCQSWNNFHFSQFTLNHKNFRFWTYLSLSYWARGCLWVFNRKLISDTLIYWCIYAPLSLSVLRMQHIAKSLKQLPEAKGTYIFEIPGDKQDLTWSSQNRPHISPPWVNYPWWCHQMETFSTLLAFCAGNSPVTGEFPTQRPATWSFDVFFDLLLNQQLSKQWRRWSFEMLLFPLWCHCNAVSVVKTLQEIHHVIMEPTFICNTYGVVKLWLAWWLLERQMQPKLIYWDRDPNKTLNLDQFATKLHSNKIE